MLSHYEERVVVASRNLERFLKGAGVTGQNLANLMNMYLFAKGVYRSTPVQFALEEGRPLPDDLGLDGVSVYHVPGHCPGQVCLHSGRYLVDGRPCPVAHHTPPGAGEHHQQHGPGSFSGVAGQDRALRGRPAGPGRARVAHGRSGRPHSATIRDLHDERLNQVLEICDEPKSIAQISQALFGRVSSYHVLLALEETGAHLEYLYQRGEVLATNLNEIENDPEPVILYQRCSGQSC